MTQLRCAGCETEVSGKYPLPQLGLLGADDQEFIVKFVLASGSLKEMAKHLGVSYPTVRNRVNHIIKTIESQNK